MLTDKVAYNIITIIINIYDYDKKKFFFNPDTRGVNESLQSQTRRKKKQMCVQIMDSRANDVK